MKYEMKMPDLATTGLVIRITRWVKQPGEAVKRGEFLLEVETDKSAMEVESTVTGKLLEVRMAADAEVAGGDVIGVFEVEDAAPVAAAQPAAAPAPKAEPVPPPPAAPAAPRAPAAASGMFARNRAAVAAPAAPVAPAAAGETILSPAQRTAARRLQESKQTVPHFYLQASVDATSLVARRAAAGDPKPVWDAFFVQAAARVLPQFERLMRRFEEGRLVPQPSANIGVAVDVGGDLFIASVDSPATQSLAGISQQIRQTVDGLRAGKPEFMRLTPGVFTISNLGSTGIDSFTAIINPPEAAILAIGAIKPVAICVDGHLAVQSRVILTLSVDHRVVNGKYAADFLAALVREIESPSA